MILCLSCAYTYIYKINGNSAILAQGMTRYL